MFHLFMLTLNLMPATGLKQQNQEQQKTGEAVECSKKHLRGTFHRKTGSLVTGDGIIIRFPQKAHIFISRNEARITAL